MRVLILGAGGMLGHKLFQTLQTKCDLWGSVKSNSAEYANYSFFEADRLLNGVDALSFDSVIRAFAYVHPDCVINCIGIVKQLKEAIDPYATISLNALFPHKLAALCKACHIRLIHISTDCVFSGNKGNYKEDDIADANDLYGRTKFLGEVQESGCLTIRASLIGRELKTRVGLVEWFLSQRGGKINGFTHAIFSGFTTHAFAAILADIIERSPALTGLYHISAAPISKYNLLRLLSEAYKIPVEIEPDPKVRIDRSLDGSRFRIATGFTPPPWESMIKEMSSDITPYDQWHQR